MFDYSCLLKVLFEKFSKEIQYSRQSSCYSQRNLGAEVEVHVVMNKELKAL